MAKIKIVKKQVGPVEKTSKALTINALDTLPNFDPTLVSNPNLPTVFADMIQFISRSDGFGILRFFSRIPGANIEISRICTNHELLKNIAVLICDNLNFYPTPKSIDKKKEV
ncbi:MAG: hypothetical protein M3Y08_08140 [Fibrobacterota bacterium]|nr:hypothetical protein [Fibrobacterota bacterium]